MPSVLSCKRERGRSFLFWTVLALIEDEARGGNAASGDGVCGKQLGQFGLFTLTHGDSGPGVRTVLERGHEERGKQRQREGRTRRKLKKQHWICRPTCARLCCCVHWNTGSFVWNQGRYDRHYGGGDGTGMLSDHATRPSKTRTRTTRYQEGQGRIHGENIHIRAGQGSFEARSPALERR
jgi:hypothetical protein